MVFALFFIIRMKIMVLLDIFHFDFTKLVESQVDQFGPMINLKNNVESQLRISRGPGLVMSEDYEVPAWTP